MDAIHVSGAGHALFVRGVVSRKGVPLGSTVRVATREHLQVGRRVRRRHRGFQARLVVLARHDIRSNKVGLAVEAVARARLLAGFLAVGQAPKPILGRRCRRRARRRARRRCTVHGNLLKIQRALRPRQHQRDIARARFGAPQDEWDALRCVRRLVRHRSNHRPGRRVRHVAFAPVGGMRPHLERVEPILVAVETIVHEDVRDEVLRPEVDLQPLVVSSSAVAHRCMRFVAVGACVVVLVDAPVSSTILIISAAEPGGDGRDFVGSDERRSWRRCRRRTRWRGRRRWRRWRRRRRRERNRSDWCARIGRLRQLAHDPVAEAAPLRPPRCFVWILWKPLVRTVLAVAAALPGTAAVLLKAVVGAAERRVVRIPRP